MKQEGEGFVRNKESKEEGVPFSLGASFRCAFSGFFYAFKSQRNMKIHVMCAILAIVAGIILTLPLFSWIAVIFCIILVLAAECFNTAIESVIDLVSPEYSKSAKWAKDAAAAAVLVCAFGSVVVAVVVYGSAVVNLLM